VDEAVSEAQEHDAAGGCSQNDGTLKSTPGDAVTAG